MDIISFLQSSKIDDYVALGFSIVGVASLVVQLLAKIAKITPNTKDDELVSKLQKGLGVVSLVLNWLALNLPKSAAKTDTKSALEDAAKSATVSAAQKVLDSVTVHGDANVKQAANDAIDALQYGKDIIDKSSSKVDKG